MNEMTKKLIDAGYGYDLSKLDTLITDWLKKHDEELWKKWNKSIAVPVPVIDPETESQEKPSPSEGLDVNTKSEFTFEPVLRDIAKSLTELLRLYERYKERPGA